MMAEMDRFRKIYDDDNSVCVKINTVSFSIKQKEFKSDNGPFAINIYVHYDPYDIVDSRFWWILVVVPGFNLVTTSTWLFINSEEAFLTRLLRMDK